MSIQLITQSQLEILKECKRSGNGIQVSEKYQIHPATLYRWKKALEQGAELTLNGKKSRVDPHMRIQTDVCCGKRLKTVVNVYHDYEKRGVQKILKSRFSNSSNPFSLDSFSEGPNQNHILSIMTPTLTNSWRWPVTFLSTFFWSLFE